MNPKTRMESETFMKSEKYQKIVKKVREKLGLRGVKEIDDKLVHRMFLACSWGVEKFGYSQNERWCSLFSTEDLKAFDYYMDLYFYYFLGPGNQINIDLGCPLLKDVLTSLQSMAGRISGPTKRKIICRFGHSGTVSSLLHALGLFIDRVPLLADNYEQMKDREFVAGRVTPMSSNIAFVLYKCSCYSKHEIYKIQFYHNERLVKLPACHSEIDCTLDEFVHYYKPFLDRCDWNRVCKV